jgi:hypothetical protein
VRLQPLDVVGEIMQVEGHESVSEPCHRVLLGRGVCPPAESRGDERRAGCLGLGQVVVGRPVPLEKSWRQVRPDGVPLRSSLGDRAAITAASLATRADRLERLAGTARAGGGAAAGERTDGRRAAADGAAVNLASSGPTVLSRSTWRLVELWFGTWQGRTGPAALLLRFVTSSAPQRRCWRSRDGLGSGGTDGPVQGSARKARRRGGSTKG